MKRPYKASTTRATTSGDVRRDFSDEQLAALGAIALAYNNVEWQIDQLFFASVSLKWLGSQVSARISVDGKLDIIKLGAEAMNLEIADREQLAEALGDAGFKRLKKYRDAAIHARPLNAAVGTGIFMDRKAKLSEVLLSVEALQKLYTHLVALRFELQDGASLLTGMAELRKLPAGDPQRAPLEAGKSLWVNQFRSHRARRTSLPPIPEFPTDAEFHAAHDQWQARLGELMGWFQEWPMPQRPTQMSAALRATLGSVEPILPPEDNSQDRSEK